MKARKEEKSSLCGVLMVLVAIAVGGVKLKFCFGK